MNGRDNGCGCGRIRVPRCAESGKSCNEPLIVTAIEMFALRPGFGKKLVAVPDVTAKFKGHVSVGYVLESSGTLGEFVGVHKKRIFPIS